MSALVCAVTGANRGIGFGLVRELCRRVPAGSTVYLLSRDLEKAKQAIDKMIAEEPSLPVQPVPGAFDLDSADSIRAFAELVRTTHGKIDVFIQNAGAHAPAPDNFNAEKHATIPEAAVKEGVAQIRANNGGQAETIASIFPILAVDGRLLLFASGFGTRASTSEEIAARLDPAQLTAAGVQALCDECCADLQSLSTAAFAAKWKGWSNFASKVLQTAGMKALVNERKSEIATKKLFVCSVCPGWTVTDATVGLLDENGKFGDIQALTVDASAKFVVNVALVNDEAARQQFFGELVQYEKVLPF